ncbi:unnamed protein product [Danaus chrysippus]|uniref:(African queen) hypothetical protein n=1 Tax=Danaus chrysippus TaxID=151541 RepID=A0A8J2VV89_9NEOP|nr:unnamed protein product [Danaus chrysippus]
MGRGGKKKTKQGIDKEMSEESSQSQPSTSTATVAVEPKQEVVTQQVTPTIEKKAVSAQVQQPKDESKEETGGLGLDLGEGRKRRPKKKKPATIVEQKPSEDVAQLKVENISLEQESQSHEAPIAVATQPSTSPLSGGTSEFPGLGRARGTGRGWGVPQQTPQSGARSVPAQQFPGQQQFGAQSAPGQKFPGHQQFGAQSAPGQQFPGQQQFGAQSVPGQQFPGQQQFGAQSAPGQQFPGQQKSGAQSRPVQQQPGQQKSGAQSRPGQQQPSQIQQSRSSSLASVASSSSSGALSRYKIPSRIEGRSVSSTKIKILTNYLEMKIKDVKVHRYDISVKPDKPKKIAQKAFAVVKEKHFPKSVIAFDQRKNCYTLTPLWKGSDERVSYNVEVADDNKVKMPFEVSLKTTGIIDLGRILNHIKTGDSSLNTPSEAIQAIDVILQQGTLENYVKVGRQFFKRPQNPIDLGFGLEMWTGLFQSAIFTWRPFINIDVAHKGFPRTQSVLDAYMKDFNLNPNQSLEQQRGYNIELFKQYLKGLKVKAFVGGDSSGKVREYIVNDVRDPPSKLTFEMTDAKGQTKRMSVANYFLTEKKLRLRYPNVNCLWVGPKNKNIFYPMELLQVSYGQALNKQLNDRQLQTMVREAATPPCERLNKIKEVINNMNYPANPIFKHFKLEIEKDFFKVDAKILQAPKLDVGAGRGVVPRNGSWQANRFLKPSALESWGLIAVEANPNDCRCDDFMQNINRIGKQMGMTVNAPKYYNFNVRSLDLKKTLYTAYEKGVNFLFIIVGGRDKNCYHKVKQIAELEVGLLTQCIKEFTAKARMSDQTIRNILLKVNSKLMGVNQALDASSIPRCISEGGVMLVGADVTHPSPDQTSVPSIAAVTASFDNFCFKYNIELSVQTPKAEIIVEFEDMIFDHLKVYKSHQRCLPRKIYVFRDGVSEGQFAQVMNSELVAIEKAYSRLDQDRKPEILFLLVQKRHHTRFFLGERDRQNVEPGTVVDTEIVHRSELDFYLVSHSALKGTARPTRYHAVANDGGLPSDEVEQLTYYLCHLYSRCMRSVSYPTPTYYAHLACLRARSLTL